jgi:superfamily II DNA or RNA helicase
MTMILSSPSRIDLPGADERVRKFLTYENKQNSFLMKRLSQNYRWKQADPNSYNARMDELKANKKKCLLMQDGETPYTYAGLWHELQGEFGWTLEVKTPACPPATRMMPWAKVPEHEIRYYQDEAVEALFAHAGHGPVAIELPTGSGKSRIIYEICKRNPVQTVIPTPSANITDALYEEMCDLFGKKFVGKYGDGRHDIGKLFTVCTAQALARVKPGTEEWEFFSKTLQFAWDESHTTPANTLQAVEFGLLKDVPNRFHISATQTRDGDELLLTGIVGPIVYKKDFRELVEEGYLARPYFKIFNVPMHGYGARNDIHLETREQLYLNPNVNRLAAEFAQKAIQLTQRPTLILIEEFTQFNALRKFIERPFDFAHGGVSETTGNKKMRDELPKQYWNSDVKECVRRFNSGESDFLIGTSAISTGVDTKRTGCLVYLQGGSGETAIKQAIGRGTRITETKKDCVMVDFKVRGSSDMVRHADKRIEIYKSMGDVEEFVK